MNEYLFHLYNAHFPVKADNMQEAIHKGMDLYLLYYPLMMSEKMFYMEKFKIEKLDEPYDINKQY